jgi:hypothetical protein
MPNWNRQIEFKLDIVTIVVISLFTVILGIYYFSIERRLDSIHEKVEFMHHRYGDYAHLENRLILLEENLNQQNK